MFLSNYHKSYRKEENGFYSCQYHVVFCTKHQRKLLDENISVRLSEIIREIALEKEFSVLEMKISTNQVHLLLDCNPEIGIVNYVKSIKHTSAKILKEEFPHLRVTAPALWTRSTFISSAGDVDIDIINEYIDVQKKKNK